MKSITKTAIALCIAMILSMVTAFAACAPSSEGSSGSLPGSGDSSTSGSKHEHTYETGWTAVDDEYHWHAPTCDDTIEGSEKSAHIWNDGEIIREATALRDGEKIYTCTVCGKTKSESVPAQGVRYTFEAEAMKTTAITEKAPTRLAEAAATGYTGTGYLGNARGATFELEIDAAAATEAYLYLRAARPAGEWTEEFVSSLTVNGSAENVSDKQSITTVKGEGADWYTWQDYAIAELKLSGGTNVISMSFGFQQNIDTVTIVSSEKIELSAEKQNGHNYTDYIAEKMPTADETGKLYRHCMICRTVEEVVLPAMTEGTYSIKHIDAIGKNAGYTVYSCGEISYTVMDEISGGDSVRLYAKDAIISGCGSAPVTLDAQKYEGVTMVAVGSKGGDVTFNFSVSEDAAVEFILDICRHKTVDYKVNRLVYILDGKEITVSGLLQINSSTASVWNELNSVSLSVQNLTAGEHTFTIRAEGAQTGCLLGISLKSAAVTEWSSSVHEHTYEDGWTAVDEEYHWHAPTCSDTKKGSDKTPHNWDNGVVVREATTVSDGEKLYTCKDCGQTKTIPIVHEHEYETGWTAVDDEYHWHAPLCDDTTEGIDKTAHVWDNGTITKPSTTTEEGERTYVCADCGRKKTESIPVSPHEHEYETGWTAVDDNYHWHAPTCGDTEEGLNKTPHVWNQGVITQEPTATEKGVKTYTCEDCGKTKLEEVPSFLTNGAIYTVDTEKYAGTLMEFENVNGNNAPAIPGITKYMISEDGSTILLVTPFDLAYASQFGANSLGYTINGTAYGNTVYYMGLSIAGAATAEELFGAAFAGNGLIVFELNEYKGYVDYTLNAYLSADGQTASAIECAVKAERFIFEAEAAEITDVTQKTPTSAPEIAATGYNGTGYLGDAIGATISLRVDSLRATTVYLYLRAARSAGNMNTEWISALTVNGSAGNVSDKQSITSAPSDSSGWFDWHEYAIAELKLSAGTNVISMTFGFNQNLDRIIILANGDITLTAEKEGHVYTDWVVTSAPTATETGRMYRYCTTCKTTEEAVLPVLSNETYTINRVEANGMNAGYTAYTVGEYTFTVMDEISDTAKTTVFYAKDSRYSGKGTNAVKLDTQKIDGIVLMSTGGKCGDMAFDFTLSEDAGVEFVLDICRYKNNTGVVYNINWFTFILDGKEIAVSDLLSVTPSSTVWNDLAPVSLFAKNLGAGEHTFVVRANGAKTGCLRGISLRSEANVLSA